MLPCGCAYHAECIQNYLQIGANSGGSLATLACPKCKLTPADCATREAQLLSVEPSVAAPVQEAVVVLDSQASAPGELPTEDGASQAHVELADSTGVGMFDAPTVSSMALGDGVAPPSPGAASNATDEYEAPPPMVPTPTGRTSSNLSSSPASSSAISMIRPVSALEGMNSGLRPFDATAETVWCSWCGHSCHWSKARLRAKSTNTWRCDVCNTKVTTLSRHFGEWPTGDFDKLTPQAQLEFFSSVRERNGKATCIQAESTLAQFERHERTYERSGSFLPLGVWGAQGYDVEAIRLNSLPEDITVDRVVGKVFRVPTITIGERGSRGHERREDLRARGRKSKADMDSLMTALMDRFALTRPAPLDAALPDEAPDPDAASSGQAPNPNAAPAGQAPARGVLELSSDDASSDESSLRGGKNGGKRKKGGKKGANKKPKKESEADRRAKEEVKQAKLALKQAALEAAAAKRAADKEASAAKKLLDKETTAKKAKAKAVFNKADGPLDELSKQLGKPRISQVGELIVSKARVLQATLQKIVANAADAHKKPDEVALEYDLNQDLVATTAPATASQCFLGMSRTCVLPHHHLYTNTQRSVRLSLCCSMHSYI